MPDTKPKRLVPAPPEAQIPVMFDRGQTPEQIADEWSTSTESVRAILRRAGRDV